MNSPKFICIGAQKAGTTWLYEMLSQNPSVWLPPVKEVHYFDAMDADEDTKKKRRQKFTRMAEAFAKARIDKGSPGTDKAAFMTSLAQSDVLTEAWYRRIFSHPDAAGRISGDITPAYMVLEDATIREVKRVAPDAKIILLVRDPVGRALSQTRMAIARSETWPENDAAWEVLVKRVVRQKRGDYAGCVPRWISVFGENNVGLFAFGDIKTNPAELMGRIESFIGAEHHANYTAIDEAIHTTKPQAIPDWVKTRFEEAFVGQKAYLAGLMGEDFVNRIA